MEDKIHYVVKEFVKDKQLLVQTIEITKRDVEQHLTQICENTHAGCDLQCPYYFMLFNKLGSHKAVANYFNELHGCPCFKNGRKILETLQEANAK